MSKRICITLAALSVMSLSATLAHAAPADDYLSVNLGEYDVLRKNQYATQYGGEYRFHDVGYGISPIIGGFGTDKGAAYGYVGLNWNVALLPNQVYIVPNFAVGAYGNGGGKDLGGTLEFRSGIELDYQFQNQQQVGVALNHISNAGIYNHNPGEETIMGIYSVPLHTITGLFN